MLLQIHDEIAVSFTSTDETKKVASIMEDAVKLNVPSKVDVEEGPSWGECE